MSLCVNDPVSVNKHVFIIIVVKNYHPQHYVRRMAVKKWHISDSVLNVILRRLVYNVTGSHLPGISVNDTIWWHIVRIVRKNSCCYPFGLSNGLTHKTETQPLHIIIKPIIASINPVSQSDLTHNNSSIFYYQNHLYIAIFDELFQKWR